MPAISPQPICLGQFPAMNTGKELWYPTRETMGKKGFTDLPESLRPSTISPESFKKPNKNDM
jgi:hypothetical protein